jgi:hypothetical protein
VVIVTSWELHGEFVRVDIGPTMRPCLDSRCGWISVKHLRMPVVTPFRDIDLAGYHWKQLTDDRWWGGHWHFWLDEVSIVVADAPPIPRTCLQVLQSSPPSSNYQQFNEPLLTFTRLWSKLGRG